MSTKLNTNLKKGISLDDLAQTDMIQELNDQDTANVNGGRGHKVSAISPYGPNGRYFGFVGY
jgi:hypothetical protein